MVSTLGFHCQGPGGSVPVQELRSRKPCSAAKNKQTKKVEHRNHTCHITLSIATTHVVKTQFKKEK